MAARGWSTPGPRPATIVNLDEFETDLMQRPRVERICHYPRSNEIAFGGVGVTARLERLDYWDGED